jgi:hypothetical protein
VEGFKLLVRPAPLVNRTISLKAADVLPAFWLSPL